MIMSILLSLLLPALVSAHGYVNRVSIDGKVYQGNSVGTTPTISSVIRQVNTNSPVKGATNPDINCGAGAQLAADVASANPGSSVQIFWVGGTTGNSTAWVHNTGPLMTYMAQCQGSCASYNSSGAQWFKIAEQGLMSDNRTWYQSELQSFAPINVTIPDNLAAGNYLLRSEIIALQLALTINGAEFYPACVQLSVGGSQTGQPTSSEEVTFPGGYTDTDPGILTPNIYNPPIQYTFPGPPVSNLVSGGSGGSSGGSGSSAASSSAVVPTSTSPIPSSPVNDGGFVPSSAPIATPSTTSSSGTNSTCMRKRSVTESQSPITEKRMQRRRHRRSH